MQMQPCPSCLSPLNAAGHKADQPGPSPGDAAICMSCGSFLMFETDLKVRLMTEAEVMELPDDARNELVRTRRKIESRPKAPPFQVLKLNIPPTDCLHCALSPVVDAFLSVHPPANLNQAACNIAQVIGEFIAANLAKRRQRHLLDDALEEVAKVTRNSALDLFRAIDKGEGPRHLNG